MKSISLKQDFSNSTKTLQIQEWADSNLQTHNITYMHNYEKYSFISLLILIIHHYHFQTTGGLVSVKLEYSYLWTGGAVHIIRTPGALCRMGYQQLVLARPTPGWGWISFLSDAPVTAWTPATTGIGHTGQAVCVISTATTGI